MDDGIEIELSANFHYDQGGFLVEEVGRYIDRLEPNSLLDIGAGAANTAVPLSQAVDRYLAIEKNGRRAARLRAEGLTVVEECFPLQLQGAYDLVLSSHSMPEESRLCQPFLDAAWRMKSPQGGLLLVTFKGSKGELLGLRRAVHPEENSRDEVLEAALAILQGFGKVELSRSSSWIRSSDHRDIVEWLLPSMPVIERNDHAKALLTETVRTRYRRKNVFEFPLEHLFIFVT